MNWSRAEVFAALEAVRAASPETRGRKKALEELERAERTLAAKANPKARVVLRFGERPAGLLASVLPQGASGLERLEKAGIEATKRKRAAPSQNPLHNALADTR